MLNLDFIESKRAEHSGGLEDPYVTELIAEIILLRADNGKLRELVRDIAEMKLAAADKRNGQQPKPKEYT